MLAVFPSLALSLALPAAKAMPGACATLARLRAPRPPVVSPTLHRFADGKATRSPFGVPNAQESDNFVLRWGNTDPPTEANRAAMLTALERSWTIQVDEMGHPPPAFSDSFKVNVFVGDTGDGAPPSYGAAGYYTPDSEGYPVLVLAPDTVAVPETGVLTAAHELYHAVQWATGSYDYGEDAAGAWYWEATASWIEVEVYPDKPEYAVFLFGFALLPQLPLDFFDYPDTGALQEYHQYGAFIFPQYLAEFEAGPELLRDSWVAPQAGSRDPLENLDAGLRAQGTELGAAFAEFAARNATWDYRDGDVYAAYVEAYGAYFPTEDQGVAARVALEPGADLGWQEVSPRRLPQRFGYSLVEVTPDEGVASVRVAVEASAEGSAGSPASWGFSLVARQGDRRTYQPLVLDGAGVASADLAVAPGTTVWLVAPAWSERRSSEETFAWRYRVLDASGLGTEDTGGTDSPPDTGGQGQGGDGGSGTTPRWSGRVQDASGGCATVGVRPAWGGTVSMLGILGLCRRRRR